MYPKKILKAHYLQNNALINIMQQVTLLYLDNGSSRDCNTYIDLFIQRGHSGRYSYGLGCYKWSLASIRLNVSGGGGGGSGGGRRSTHTYTLGSIVALEGKGKKGRSCVVRVVVVGWVTHALYLHHTHIHNWPSLHTYTGWSNLVHRQMCNKIIIH